MRANHSPVEMTEVDLGACSRRAHATLCRAGAGARALCIRSSYSALCHRSVVEKRLMYGEWHDNADYCHMYNIALIVL